jgi:hypothetical protein
VISRSSTNVKLEWREPGTTAGCPITGYSVLADDGLRGQLTAVTLPNSASELPPTQSTFEVASPASASFELGREYRFAIVASTVVGSLQSNVVAAVVADLPGAPVAGPTLVKAETGIDRIRLSFAAFDGTSASATGGSPILSYQLQRTPALSTVQRDQITDSYFDVGGASSNASLGTEYTVRGLERGQAYGFRYRAVNINGPGPWSPESILVAATLPSAPAAAPAYVSSTDS